MVTETQKIKVMTKELKNPTVFPQEYIDRMNEQLDELLGPKKQLTISDMKIGDMFLMDGLDMDCKPTKVEAELISSPTLSPFKVVKTGGQNVIVYGDDKVYLK